MSRVSARMPAEERRELILAAATRSFALGGYAGTSTDLIAKEAGVSQPYVVRMFGTKLDLFLAVLARACASIDDAFARVIASPDFDPETADVQLGTAYTALLADSDLLRVMMHGFATGGVPEIAATARAGMARIYATLRSTGWDNDQVRDFLAVGMLLNVLLSMGAFTPAGASEGLADLIGSCLPEELIARVEQGE